MVQMDPQTKPADRYAPGNVVTLVRAVLSCSVAVLVAIEFAGSEQVTAVAVISAIAILLDWVDGQVARRTHTESAFGARFDMEVDAFLILVLSVYVAASVGVWVLAIGLARYVLLGAERVLPWLRRPTPPRYWGKVVAALQGIVLTVAAADLLPHPLTVLALVVALALLAESFARQVWWLWRSRLGGTVDTRFTAPVTFLAILLIWVGLTLPNQSDELSPSAFIKLPLEALVFVGLLAFLTARLRDVVAVVGGVLLAVITAAKVLDMGFVFALNRPFDPLIDWTYARSLVELLRDSFGMPTAILLLAGAALLNVAIFVLMPLALRRLARIVASHRTVSLSAATGLAMAWVVTAALGISFGQNAPLASANAADYAATKVSRVQSKLDDQQRFAAGTATDPLRDVPGEELLTKLRGKDVIFAFVESYGRSAVEGSSFSPGINDVLDEGTRRLRADGFDSRSAFLTSPTFGAVSWLAHATLQSGLWVDSQQRYDKLFTTNRLTLSTLFKRAGWRTVSDIPANTRDWPEGQFYDFDQYYDSRNVGYRGPRFGYPTMPDQYTLDAFQRLELGKSPRKPVMAEIDLITSHAPWSRTPQMIEQGDVGDGSIFKGMPERAQSKSEVWRSSDRVRAAYGKSIEYSLDALITFVETYGDDNLVLVLLGDHQPATIVSGKDADHDVPITVISRDRAVLRRVTGWGWETGMRPSPDAPVWRMDSFRGRFLHTFGP